MTKHVVAKVGEIGPGTRLIVTVAGRSIGVFNVGGKLYALRNRCPHQGGPLCEGGPVQSRLESAGPGNYLLRTETKLVACPWHGWEYDLATGQSWWSPTRSRVRAYPVSVLADELMEESLEPGPAGRIKGPYVAETYEVGVAEALVVVELPDHMNAE
jgi:3-phenylpropionate/trans-cinnamate dioxygenase ferredoxin subunit